MRNLTKISQVRILLTATTALVALPASSWAQTNADQYFLEEIIVTAQKRSESILDAPLAISALTGDQMKAAGITDLGSLDRAVPGFSVETTYTGNPVFFIRGVGFSDPAPINAPTVSVYVDQIALPYSIMSRGAILDLERVEVLKGPQGTLFGQNSTGGAVNFIAAKPTSDLSAGANLSYGRFNSIEAEGFISGPITETLGFRVAARRETQDDWQRSVTRPNDTRGSKDFLNGRVTLEWTPTDEIGFHLTGQAWNDHSDIQGAQFVVFTAQKTGPDSYAPAFAAFAGRPPAPRESRLADWDPNSETERNSQFRQIALEGNIDMSDSVQLTSITAYTETKVFHPNDLDGTDYPDLFNEVNADIKSFSQELRLNGDVDDLEWMIGGNFQRDKTSNVTPAFTENTISQSFGIHFPGSVAIAEDTIKTYGIFGGLDFALTDTVTARGSARYTRSKDDHYACTADGGDGSLATIFSLIGTGLSGTSVAIPPGGCVTIDSTTNLPGPIYSELDEDNVSWRVGVDWKVDPDTMIYGTLAKGYKAGGYTNTGFANSDQVNPVKQESLLAYEVGVKASLADNRVQTNLSGFYYDYKDKQLGGFINIVPFGPLPTLVSIPESRVYGAEIDIDALVTASLRARFSASYIDSKAKKDPINASDPFGNEASFVGERFPQTSKYQANLDLEQTFSVSNGANIYVGGSLIYRSDASAQFGSESSALAKSLLTIPSYTLLDLRLGMRLNDDKTVVELWGRNVTDKYYATSIVKASDTVMRFTGMPATYGIRALWQF